MKYPLIAILTIACAMPAMAQHTAPYKAPTESGEYLNTVQQHTFKYFWDFAHPVSGMAPERSATPNIVTSGGTGFGVMCLVVGTYRQWISRRQAVDRLLQMTRFLEKAERFHGAWPHWMDGNTGKVVPFGQHDDGGDLVETAYLINGLLVAQAYFDSPTPQETELRQRIERLWRGVEWSWYVHEGKLLWHWSPRYQWKMNHAIGGYNECLITYVLALGSPTHPISPEVYVNTWKKAEPWHYRNGKEFVGYTLPLGFDYGGPLFFAHYSYLSLDPRLMQDQDTNYWTLNLSHTLINRAHCLERAPKEYGYSPENWGLTASDDFDFYGAHQPTEDNSTISPTAALSSFVYTPAYSMQVLKYLYRIQGNRLFGPYGFYDAYSQLKNWYSNQYLAIDQGPIVVMIENYRSGLVWQLGQRVPVLWKGLEKMGITKPKYPTGFYMYIPDQQTGTVDLIRHADEGKFVVDFAVSGTQPVTLELVSNDSMAVLLSKVQLASGTHRHFFEAPFGAYTLRLTQGDSVYSIKTHLRWW